MMYMMRAVRSDARRKSPVLSVQEIWVRDAVMDREEICQVGSNSRRMSLNMSQMADIIDLRYRIDQAKPLTTPVSPEWRPHVRHDSQYRAFRNVYALDRMAEIRMMIAGLLMSYANGVVRTWGPYSLVARPYILGLLPAPVSFVDERDTRFGSSLMVCLSIDPSWRDDEVCQLRESKLEVLTV